MKFKARLRLQAVPELIRALQALDKTEKEGVLYLKNPENRHFAFISQQQHPSALLQAYLVFEQTLVFDDYHIVSKNNNNIGLSLEIASFLRA